jgi:hypothetical protein
MSEAHPRTAELSVSDYAQIGSLADYLRLSEPDIRVTRGAGRLGPGELGALDVLTIAADSTVLVAVINALPEFLRSRKKKGLSVTVKVKDKKLTVTADNAKEVIEIVDHFLDS